VLGSVCEEVSPDYGMSRVVEAHRPAKHIELVSRAGANRIRTVLDEQLHDRQVAALGGKVKRKCVISFVADVGIGSAFEEGPDDRFVPDTEMKRSSHAGIAGQGSALVDEARMFVEDSGDGRRVSLAGSVEEPRERRLRRIAVGSCTGEGDPTLVSAFAREGMLNVTERDVFGRAGVHANESRARVSIAVTQCFEPALGGLAQIVQGGHVKPPSVRCLGSAWRQAGRRFEPQDRTGWVGGTLPCRGQEAPQCALS
jgi:hypothetical protein